MFYSLDSLERPISFNIVSDIFMLIFLSLDNYLQMKATSHVEQGCGATCSAYLTVWRAAAYCRSACAVVPVAVKQPVVTFSNLNHLDL